MRGTAAVAGMVASLVLAAPAHALDIRSGAVSDPRDLAPEPQRFEPDLAALRASHAELQVQVRLRFHNGPWEGGPELDSYRGPSGGFRAVFGQRVDGDRCVTGLPGDAVVEGVFHPDVAHASLSIVGQGAVDYGRDHSRNGSEDMYTFASSAFGGRIYHCVGEIRTYRESELDRVRDLVFNEMTIVDPGPDRAPPLGQPVRRGHQDHLAGQEYQAQRGR